MDESIVCNPGLWACEAFAASNRTARAGAGFPGLRKPEPLQVARFTDHHWTPVRSGAGTIRAKEGRGAAIDRLDMLLAVSIKSRQIPGEAASC